MAKKTDALTLLSDDHRTVEKLFAEFDATGPRAHKTRAKLVEKIVHELAVHAAIEEMAFYPVIRELSKEIEDHVLESLEEHHVAKWVLSELDGMDPQAERFVAKVTVLKETIEHHVEEEESELFTMVRKAAEPQLLVDLAEALTAAKSVAPTRPHPRSPDTPPGNAVSMVAGLVDRARDGVRDLTRR